MTAVLDEPGIDALDLGPDEGEVSDLFTEEALDEDSKEFLQWITERILRFMFELVGYSLHPYQTKLAYRIVQSVVNNDGAEITALMARQSGKTETVADVLATLMIVLPRLAPLYPSWFGDYKDGVMIGCFAPTDEQAQTLFSRIVQRLTSPTALELLMDEEINDRPVAKGKLLELVQCKSFVRLQTAHPKASIESKTYHIIVIDEAQDCDRKVVRKSIHPMGASTNATRIKIGTPSYTKGEFYEAIRTNKRKEGARGGQQNHFEANWREVIKYNKKYRKFIAKEKEDIGEESDEFQLAYNLKWLLERGMFTTEEQMDSLGDKGMPLIKQWKDSPLIAGVDVARRQDSTVVTVGWVDWENPDESGYCDHRVLNWLELHGDRWEEQYAQVIDFLAPYDVRFVAVDGNGMGDVFADRLDRLMPQAEVVALESSPQEQSKRWKHLTTLMERELISWPAHASVRRTRVYKRFRAQMLDAERNYKGKNMLVAAPEVADAHDDYPDSLALMTWLTKGVTMPEVEQSDNVFYDRRRSA